VKLLNQDETTDEITRKCNITKEIHQIMVEEVYL
jgi:hypothetical protein